MAIYSIKNINELANMSNNNENIYIMGAEVAYENFIIDANNAVMFGYSGLYESTNNSGILTKVKEFFAKIKTAIVTFFKNIISKVKSLFKKKDKSDNVNIPKSPTAIEAKGSWEISIVDGKIVNALQNAVEDATDDVDDPTRMEESASKAIAAMNKVDFNQFVSKKSINTEKEARAEYANWISDINTITRGLEATQKEVSDFSNTMENMTVEEMQKETGMDQAFAQKAMAISKKIITVINRKVTDSVKVVNKVYNDSVPVFRKFGLEV